MKESQEFVDTKPIEHVLENIGVKSIFGEPTKEHDEVIIPVAQVAFGFGYGGGFGEGSVKNKDGVEANSDAASDPAKGEMIGGGGGGGAGGRTSPRGFIRINNDGVKFEPIDNQMMIPIAGILMVMWSVFWVTATVRHIAKQVAKTKQVKLRAS